MERHNKNYLLCERTSKYLEEKEKPPVCFLVLLEPYILFLIKEM